MFFKFTCVYKSLYFLYVEIIQNAFYSVLKNYNYYFFSNIAFLNKESKIIKNYFKDILNLIYKAECYLLYFIFMLQGSLLQYFRMKLILA